MSFNRQVLEQVARDGVTYKELAKQMAQALLGGTGQSLPTRMHVILSADDYETQRLEEWSKGSPIPIYQFDTNFHSTPSGNSYVSYIMTLRTPGEKR